MVVVSVCPGYVVSMSDNGVRIQVVCSVFIPEWYFDRRLPVLLFDQDGYFS